VGPVRFSLLRNHFGSAKRAWDAPVADLVAAGLPQHVATEIHSFRQSFDIQGYFAKLASLAVVALPLTHPKYPALLREIPDPPFVLYVKGKKPDTPIDLTRTIGVVGTREVTEYGREITRTLVSDLVRLGFTIVSGLARGVDAVAHEAALAAGGNTIAVLGCGIDIVAPESNAYLYRAISEGGGAIVSEMPLGVRPSKGLFVVRNRIISGLSLGVVVTQGAEDSGALITARAAGEQGREVFAVPGPVTSPLSRAPAKLLKNGATLVENAQDIVEELGV
jgi:DNA processing protein